MFFVAFILKQIVVQTDLKTYLSLEEKLKVKLQIQYKADMACHVCAVTWMGDKNELTKDCLRTRLDFQ